MKPPIYSRLLGFDAGPQNHVFHACADHMTSLDRADVMCFHALRDHPTRYIKWEDTDEECYFCRGEHGP